jgi:hypothetical protein
VLCNLGDQPVNLGAGPWVAAARALGQDGDAEAAQERVRLPLRRQIVQLGHSSVGLLGERVRLRPQVVHQTQGWSPPRATLASRNLTDEPR